MNQNFLRSAWSEKFALSMEENIDNGPYKKNPRRRRSSNNFENENIFNSTTLVNDTAFTPNAHLTDNNNITFQRGSRRNNEMDCDTQNLTLSHTPSCDTLYSRGSRNVSRHSPPGSYRSIRSSAAPYPTPSPLEIECNTNSGVNIIMLIGLAIGIAFGYILNITEVCLNWFQLKLTDLQLHVFAGKSIQEFYTQEETTARKIVFFPLSALLLILQFVLYVIILSIGFLKKPAPKALVSNVMKRYVNEQKESY